MGILGGLFRERTPDMEDDKPEFKQHKKYRLCVEDNPNEKKYLGCGKRDVYSPACKLTLYLEELTHEEVVELDMEIHNMLDRHNFELR